MMVRDGCKIEVGLFEDYDEDDVDSSLTVSLFDISIDRHLACSIFLYRSCSEDMYSRHEEVFRGA